jgi:hypothetical protein
MTAYELAVIAQERLFPLAPLELVALLLGLLLRPQ